jgi:hypothetical protein
MSGEINPRLETMLRDGQIGTTGARDNGGGDSVATRRKAVSSIGKTKRDVDEEVLRVVEAELAGYRASRGNIDPAVRGEPRASLEMILQEVEDGVIRSAQVEAVARCRGAAEQGIAEAQTNLGVMYSIGQIVSRDDAEAVKWYWRAANQGLARAQYNLGVMYAKGQSVPHDDVLAYMWFSLAAAQANQKAAKARDLIASLVTSSQLAEAQRLAEEWRPKAER